MLVGVLPGSGPEALQELIAAPTSREQLTASCRGLKKALLERALEAELTHYLGYPKGGQIPRGQLNHRNGTSLKTIYTEAGALHLEIPRDRTGAFEPLLVNRHRRRFHGFDDRIMAMYSRGDSLAEIEKHLRHMYDAEVSPNLFRDVSQAVLDQVGSWRQRTLQPVYPVVFFHRLGLDIQGAWVSEQTAVHLALGLLPDGTRDILGIWTGQGDGAQYWQTVLTDLGQRGVTDILIAVLSDPKGFPGAMDDNPSWAAGQTCLVHITRNCPSLAAWKGREAASRRTLYATAS
jgi:putative transposase